ncbi:MAG TPA: ATP-binding protein [Candidatus Sulfotelmatobacter sp.]|nr:ATP-binding protein [Candidatus Sulfotelmatobacter sp.]
MSVIKAPAEVCPLCDGTGWKPAPTATTTKDRRVTRCDCQLRSRTQSLLTAARIPRRYEHCELANFEFDGPHRSLAPARMAACRFVEEYPIERTGLLFVGKTGRGKTHLAVGIAKALIREKGVECIYYDYAELLKEIQDSYNPSVDATELGLLRPVFDAEVLVLDDLGSVRPTEWRWDTIRLILNTRYNENRTTIITTNFPDEPAAAVAIPEARKSSETFTAARAAAREDTLGDRIGETMRSRLHEMCRLVSMEGQDFRASMLNASAIAVACGDCPKCGKENVYRRVGALRKPINSTLNTQITCKKCGEVFYIPKNQLQIRKKTRRELDAEYSVESLEWM